MSNEPLEREPMNNEPLEREPIDRVRASKRTGKPCQAAAMPNGRCKLHGGKSTGPRTPEGLERSRRANWKHGHQGGTVARAGGNTCGPPSARLDLKAPAVPRSDTDHTGPSISAASMPMVARASARRRFGALELTGPLRPYGSAHVGPGLAMDTNCSD